MSIRPLHFLRDSGGLLYMREGHENMPVARGVGMYITDDGYWSIGRTRSGWKINLQVYTPNQHQKVLHGAVDDAGLYDQYFPRRIDAAQALEHIIQMYENK